MNAERLLEHFDRISDAPDAVPRLKRFVRSLAVRGLLSRLGSEIGGTSRETSRLLEKADVAPWLLPRGWEWRSVSDCGDFRFGKMLDKAKNRGKPRRYLRNVNVRWFDFNLGDVLEMRFEDDELPEYSLRRGDILICEGGEPGRAAIWDEREKGMLFQKAIHRVRFRDGVMPEYFLITLKDSADSGRLATLFTGVTIKHLTGKGLGQFTFPLPPLDEQKRIVAKVAELMALCDRLEAAQAAREARRDRLVSASLARMTEPASHAPSFARTYARFNLDHFARLTTRPEHVKQLRQTILNLAVRGRLVQTPVDYNQTRLGEVATVQNGYAFKSQWFLKVGTRLLRNTNVSHGTLCWNECVCLSQKQTEEFDRFQLSSGDIVLSLDRPFISSGTKVAVVRDSDIPCLLLQRVGRFIINREAIAAEYLFLWVTSSHFKDQVAPGRSLGVPHIAAKDVEAAAIDLPPLGEQQRIIAKVAKLMDLCDQLEASLSSAANERALLLEATLRDALAPVM